MNPFIQWLSQYWPECVAAFLSVVSGTIAGVNLFVSRKTARYIAKAKARDTYVKCPHCDKVVPLNQLDFFLPGGKVDNNLNGIPDEDEK